MANFLGFPDSIPAFGNSTVPLARIPADALTDNHVVHSKFADGSAVCYDGVDPNLTTMEAALGDAIEKRVVHDGTVFLCCDGMDCFCNDAEDTLYVFCDNNYCRRAVNIVHYPPLMRAAVEKHLELGFPIHCNRNCQNSMITMRSNDLTFNTTTSATHDDLCRVLNAASVELAINDRAFDFAGRTLTEIDAHAFIKQAGLKELIKVGAKQFHAGKNQFTTTDVLVRLMRKNPQIVSAFRTYSAQMDGYYFSYVPREDVCVMSAEQLFSCYETEMTPPPDTKNPQVWVTNFGRIYKCTPEAVRLYKKLPYEYVFPSDNSHVEEKIGRKWSFVHLIMDNGEWIDYSDMSDRTLPPRTALALGVSIKNFLSALKERGLAVPDLHPRHLCVRMIDGLLDFRLTPVAPIMSYEHAPKHWARETLRRFNDQLSRSDKVRWKTISFFKLRLHEMEMNVGRKRPNPVKEALRTEKRARVEVIEVE